MSGLSGSANSLITYDFSQEQVMRAFWKVYGHLEYLKNRSCGIDVTWQPLRGDLAVHP
jgi:hypothetical protein